MRHGDVGTDQTGCTIVFYTLHTQQKGCFKGSEWGMPHFENIEDCLCFPLHSLLNPYQGLMVRVVRIAKENTNNPQYFQNEACPTQNL